MSYRRREPPRSHLSDRDLVCDGHGCGARLDEDDPSVVVIRLGRQGQANWTQVELCALCASRERANETVLGRFLSDPFCRAGAPS